MPPTSTALWWIRHDLRLADNSALSLAAAHGSAVVPVFVLDPDILHSTYHRAADNRKAFLFNGIRALDADLRQLGSRLIVRQGRALPALAALAAEAHATAIFAGDDFSPNGAQRDTHVARHLPLTLVNDHTVHHPARMLAADGRP